MNLATLFGKLQEHEMKLKRLIDDKEDDKNNNKCLSLKVTNTKDMILEYEDKKKPN